MIVLREFAPAKINLYLHVLGKRADGYHLLDSLVAFANTGDIVQAAPADDITLTIEHNHGLQPATNSVLKAAHALRDFAHVKAGAKIILHKYLPVAAGLGGGSADAAATLRLLIRLWNLSVSHSDLMALAITLGADVPACLHSTSLYMGGVGEWVEEGPSLKGMALLLVNPGKFLNTPEVFAARSGNFSSPPRHPREFASHKACVEFLAKAKNDLQTAAISLVPEIFDVIEMLLRQKECSLARMSGSGATCFGIFDHAQSAQKAANAISAAHPHWWVKSALIQ